MKDDNLRIEQRIQNMKNFYKKAGALIDKLPDAIPVATRNMLKDTVLGDKELKKLMEGIENHRPPRIFMIGRTGVGKSSLINAICGTYAADVSDTRSCTSQTSIYQCKDGDRVLMEICDTRGFAESESINPNVSAEEMLISQINEFSPDVALFMLNCTHRDDVNKDVEFLKKLAKEYKDLNSIRLPIVAVVNKCDEMAPSRFKNPDEYPQGKIAKINEVVEHYKNIIEKSELDIDGIIGVSSLIDWATPNGDEIGTEEIALLSPEDLQNITIAFDGRYNIDKLIDILEEAILDCEAQMGLRMAARLTEVVKRLAKHLNSIFSGIAATVAITPIPVADVYVLLILQAILVTLIASLSGRDVSMESAKEFIFALGGVAGMGYTFRLIAQQSVKFLNGIWPGSGSAVSSGIAALGTAAIGRAAITYYIDEKSIEEAKKNFDKDKEINE